MKSILPLLLLFCVVFNEVLGSAEDDWCAFKSNFYKEYKSKKEEEKRFKAFKKNVKEINKHNKRFALGLETFEKGFTTFADLTEKEFNAKYGFRPSSYMKSYEDINNNNTTTNTSEFLDWRTIGAVTPVKDQGTCGACWIFSAIGMLEGYNFIKTSKLVSLSEQDVVDCFLLKTCKGGFPGDAIMHIKKSGVSKEIDYPYREKQNTCKTYMPRIKIDFEGFKFLNGTENDLKNALDVYGPIGVSLYVGGNWRLYKRGVWFESECSEQTNHAALVVGYGTENGNDYWLVKNSWGPLWGEEGYIKIARNKHENYCGLTKEAMQLF